MKRLLRVGFDIFVSSLTPIITWFFVGIIIDKNLTNVFTLTYPLQCLFGIVVSIFGVGANVYAIRDKKTNAVDNGIIYGIIFSVICYELIALRAKDYINFMNMDSEFYLIMGTYSILQILLQIILHLVLTKLYYLEKNKEANKLSLSFNALNFITFISMALFTGNQIYTVVITLLVLSIFDIGILLKNVKKFDWKLNLKKCIRYDSVACTANVLFFVMYLFGFSNSFSFGTKYVVAITFATLATDIQWDMASAIKTVAKIDIVKKKFNYEEHIKNATKYIYFLILSILLMGLVIYPIYKPSIMIVSIFLLLHIIDFMMTPVTNVNMCYLEIEYSPTEATLNMMIAYVLRTIISLLPTPFCTIIGQIVSSIYEFIYAIVGYKKAKKTS